MVIGFAKWTDFHHHDEKQKLYFIEVDFTTKKVSFNHKNSKAERGEAVLKNGNEIAQAIRNIKLVWTENSWAKHLQYENYVELQHYVIKQMIGSDKTFLEIKKEFY